MRTRGLVALAAATMLLLTGCSGGAQSPGATTDGGLETDTVRYGTFATGLSSREVLIAQELGYFQEAGITVEFQNLASTAALVPLLASGQLDMAYLSYQPAFNALEAGLDITLVGHTQNIDPGVQQLFVASDSDIDSLADLKGKRIGLNAVGGYGDVLLGEALGTVGLTLDDVELAEVQFSNMIGALEQGEIQVGWLPSSFVAVAAADPEQRVRMLYDFHDVPSLQNLPQGGDVASGAFARKNPNTVAAFMNAVQRSADYIAANPDYDRQQQASLAGFAPAVAEKIELFAYRGTVTPAELQRVADLQRKYGQLTGDIDIETFTAGLRR